MNDLDTGMVPVRDHLSEGDPLPADLARPRDPRRRSLIAGLIVGGVLIILDVALLALAILV